MKDSCQFFRRFLARLFSIAIFLLFFTIVTLTASAQIPSVFREVRQAEWELKNPTRAVMATSGADQPNWNRTRQDFLQLQIESEKLQLLAQSATALDYKYLKAEIGVVEKLAERLQRRLPLPRLNEAVAFSENELPLPNAITELDRLVIRFAANPVFKREQIFDIHDGATAAVDLALIIVICKNLGKRVEKLSR